MAGSRAHGILGQCLSLLLGLPAPCQGLDATAAACGACHVDTHAEWLASAHARAFTDPVFQRALATRTRPDLCLPCHAPEPVLDRLGQLPRTRTERRDEGVGCVACHQRGLVLHGPFGPTTDAHATAADPTFGRRSSVALCVGCHDLRIADVLPLGREFAAAGLLEQGESCVGCHMERRPPVATKAPGGRAAALAVAARTGRSHQLLGPGDPDFCASAFLLRIETTAAGAELVLGNGAGHGVPGLARLRSFTFRLAWLAADARTLREQQFSVSWPDRLAAEEERRIVLPAVSDAVVLRVQVDHIFAGQKLATVLDRTLELP